MFRKRFGFRPNLEALDHRAAVSSLAVTPDLGLMASLVAPPAPANLTFNDGGFHVLSKPAGYVDVYARTMLQVNAGAVISGADMSHQYPAALYGENATVAILGGTITSAAGNLSLNLNGCTAFIDGGYFPNGSSISVSSGTYGSYPPIVQFAAITGGRFGGSGCALTISTYFGGYVAISGGTFSSTNPDGSPGSAMRIQQTGGTVDIAGGKFTGTIVLALSSRGPDTVDFHGTGMNYSASTGMLTGKLYSGDPINVHMVPTVGWMFTVATNNSHEVTFHGSPSA